MPRAKTGKKPKSVKNLVWKHEKWYSRFYVDGREISESLYTDDLSQAKERLKERKTAFDDKREKTESAARKLKSGQMSWPHAVGRFLEEVSASISPKTLARYEGSILKADSHFNSKTMHEIEHKDIADYVSMRKTTPDHKSKKSKTDGLVPVTNATINRDLTAISQLMEYCIHWGVANENPVKKFNRRMMTKERSDPRYIATLDEVTKIAAEFDDMYAEGIWFAYLTGARQHETFNAKWSQVTLSNDSSKQSSMRLIGKGNRVRTIKLSPQAEALLVGLEMPKTGNVIFWHGNGENYKEPAHKFSDASKALREREKTFPAFTYHDLRHAYAVNYLLNGGDIYDLSRHLGHSTIKMTERYLGYMPGGKAISR